MKKQHKAKAAPKLKSLYLLTRAEFDKLPVAIQNMYARKWVKGKANWPTKVNLVAPTLLDTDCFSPRTKLVVSYKGPSTESKFISTYKLVRNSHNIPLETLRKQLRSWLIN